MIRPVRAGVMASVLCLGSASYSVAAPDNPFAVPGMTGEQLAALPGKRQSEVLGKAVRDGSVVSRGKCEPGAAKLVKRSGSAYFWKIECLGGMNHLVIMPTRADKAASVLACPLAKMMIGVDCQ